MRNYTYDEWAAQERAADERRHKRQQYELLDPLELECACIEIGDQADARGCPLHGERAAWAEAEAEADASGQIRYYGQEAAR